MPNAVFGWTNWIASAGLATSSAATGLDASQLRNDQGSASTAWQTTTTSGTLTVDAGAAVTWRAFALARTNLTTASTWRVRVGNDSAFGSAIYDSGTISTGLAVGYGQAVLVATADQTARYCRIDISDASNPDGFLNLPLAYAGPVWQPMTNISYDSTIGRDDQTDEVVSRGGSEYPVMQYQRRRWDVTLAGIRQTELWAQAGELDRYARTGGNVLFVPTPNGSDQAREAIYGGHVRQHGGNCGAG